MYITDIEEFLNIKCKSCDEKLLYYYNDLDDKDYSSHKSKFGTKCKNDFKIIIGEDFYKNKILRELSFVTEKYMFVYRSECPEDCEWFDSSLYICSNILYSNTTPFETGINDTLEKYFDLAINFDVEGILKKIDNYWILS